MYRAGPAVYEHLIPPSGTGPLNAGLYASPLPYYFLAIIERSRLFRFMKSMSILAVNYDRYRQGEVTVM